MSWDIILLSLLVIAALFSVLAIRLINAAIGLAVASGILSLLIYKMGAPFAAVFELSVCAGLITVIFISTISLVKPLTAQEIEERKAIRLRKYWFLPLLIILGGIFIANLRFPTDLKLPLPAADTDVRTIFWNLRQTDLLGQIGLILAGVFGIVILFREGTKK